MFKSDDYLRRLEIAEKPDGAMMVCDYEADQVLTFLAKTRCKFARKPKETLIKGGALTTFSGLRYFGVWR